MTFFLHRQRLLDRVLRRAAPVTALIAPPGFGKSYLAQQIARLDVKWSEIDCARDLAPQLSEWQRLSEPQTLILENLECLEDPEASQAIVSALLPERPGGGKLVVCTRSDRVLHFGDLVAPHLLTTIRGDQLAFDDDDMRELFAGANLSEALFHRVTRFTEGWPVPALYCAQLAHDGDLENAFREMKPEAFADLFDYVDRQVLTQLQPRLLQALYTLAGGIYLGPEELDQIFGVKADDVPFGELIRHFQFARMGPQHRLEISPLIAAVIRDRHAMEMQDALIAVARFHATRHDLTGAAKCYLQAGQIDKAAEALRMTNGADLESAYLVSRLPETCDAASLKYYPEVWAAFARARRLTESPEILVHEAAMVFESLEPDCADTLFNTIVALNAVFLADTGRLGEARTMLEQARRGDAGMLNDPGGLRLAGARAAIDTMEGRSREALAAWHKIQRHVLAQKIWFAQLMQIEISAARASGQWEVEYQSIEHMLSVAHQAGSPATIALSLVEGAFGAWLAGEDELLQNYRAQLVRLLRQEDLPVFLNFSLALQGLPLAPSSRGSFECDAYAHLLAAVEKRDPFEAATSAHLAQTFADKAGIGLVRVLTRIASAEKVPAVRSTRLQEALEIAETIDSTALIESIRHLIVHGEPRGMLTPFINRLRVRTSGFEPARCNQSHLAIHFADATADRNGDQIPVSEGSWALLAALSINQREVARDVLCDRLWPAMPLESARNALKMCVRRTRQQLGAAEAIVSIKGAYALGEGMQVDLHRLTSLRATIARKPLADDLVTIERAFDRLKSGRPAAFLAWAWFEETERSLLAATRELGEALARDALQRDDHLRALEISQFLTALDPFDEAAREMTISAHLAARHRGAALIEYRQYRKVLKDELAVEPSAVLHQLFSGQ
jgi:DNA-binding SARP family transcriptional activator